MSQFVETKKTVKRVIDGELSNGARISVNPRDDGTVDIVIGAQYKNIFCSSFSKRNLAQLIDILKEIHSAME